MDTETSLHVLYVAVMAAGAGLFVWWGLRDPRGVPRWEYLVATAIPVWSGVAYTALAFDLGLVEVDGQIAHLPRYADWIVTTPLLLLALSFTAMHGMRKDPVLISALLGTQVVVIASGAVADVSEGAARYTFYGIGCAAFVVVLLLVWLPLRRIAEHQDEQIGRTYRTVAGLLTVLWIAYPLVWILGPSGVEVIPQVADTALFVIVPALSKVGWSIVDLSLLRRLPEKDRSPATTEQPTRSLTDAGDEGVSVRA